MHSGTSTAGLSQFTKPSSGSQTCTHLPGATVQRMTLDPSCSSAAWPRAARGRAKAWTHGGNKCCIVNGPQPSHSGHIHSIDQSVFLDLARHSMATNRTDKKRHNAPTVMYTAPRKLFFPPIHDMVDSTTFLLPPKSDTS
jgi:hypothetical protein|eukprot:COSAG06_NODE_7304_length_2552_cov_1.569914_3_plen_140_part_00